MPRHARLPRPSTLVLAAAVAALVLALAPSAQATHPQPAPDINHMDYSPIGHFKPGDLVPGTTSHDTVFAPLMSGRKFNPSGKYNAFDNNVFETLSLPFRAAGDETADDPYGNGGDPRHGYCRQPHNPIARPGNAALMPGVCPNHALEWGDYYAETMREILGDFGVSIRRYEFQVPQPAPGDNTLGGKAHNVAAVVPGADHPDETVLVGAHYDQTNDGPASAWDSAEGHAQVIRMAKIMADYWRATGTRPSATVKFIPWAGEEAGILGSKDYAANNIVPGEEHEVRSYWNTDPCAGGYPAFRRGIPGERVDLGIQVADPDEVPPAVDKSRIKAFNETAIPLVEQVFEHLDDTVTVGGSPVDIFVSSAEGGGEGQGDIGNDVIIGDDRPLLFGSDWLSFEALGIPFFNPGPEITGPSNGGQPGNPDGLAILHTPNDNLKTLNTYTGSTAPDGSTFSEGWIKGMEMCAHLLSWGMLQPEHGGGQTINNDVVAYYEALPNEALVSQRVKFDASGSYQYASLTTRERVDESKLEFKWDFGDGTSGEGREAEHAYSVPGTYETTLTVRNVDTGQTDTQKVPVKVVGSKIDAPRLTPPPAEDPDGAFKLEWTYTKPIPPSPFEFDRYSVEESRDLTTHLSDDAEADIAEKWEVQEPTSDMVEPWQASDSDTDKYRGNLRKSGQRSYWTGLTPDNQGVATMEPLNEESVMVFKEPIDVPRVGPFLTYWSEFRNDDLDSGRVEVALDTGSEDLEWEVVDEVGLGARSRDRCILPTCPALAANFEFRQADLTPYAGKKIRLRFVYALGGFNRANVDRDGWYVDDLAVLSGTWTEIGAPAEESFEVTGRGNGTYSYRVKAVFKDGVKTASSSIEKVKVGTGVFDNPPGGGGGGGGGTTGGGTTGGGTQGDRARARLTSTARCRRSARRGRLVVARCLTQGRLTVSAGGPRCSGRVRVTVKRGRRTISSRLVRVRANCTFRSPVRVRVRTRASQPKLRIFARFAGTRELSPASARTRTVRVTARGTRPN